MSDEARLSPDDILVRVQETPNPYALKFIVNQLVIANGNATFTDVSEAEDIVLVRDLLKLSSVKQVYVFENTLTLTHDGAIGPEDLVESVTSILKTRLPIHDPSQVSSPSSNQPLKQEKDRSQMSAEMREFEEILDRTIRPGLQADGGDIELLSFEENILKILYMGACGGCPSAMMGTLDAIQGILQNETNNPDLRVYPV